MSKYGYVETYKGYKIINTPSCYVITNEHGLNVGETKFGLPVARGIIDSLVKERSK